MIRSVKILRFGLFISLVSVDNNDAILNHIIVMKDFFKIRIFVINHISVEGRYRQKSLFH